MIKKYYKTKLSLIFLLVCIINNIQAESTTTSFNNLYGLDIPPTNTTLLKQEHQRQSDQYMQNINDIVHSAINTELKKHKKGKRKKSSEKKYEKCCTAGCSANSIQQSAIKAVSDLFIPETLRLLDKQFNHPELVNKKITISLQEVGIRNAIDLIRKLTGLNFILDADVDGSIKDFSFKDTSLAVVLSVLLANNIPRLSLFYKHGAWRILKQATALNELKITTEEAIELDTVTEKITTFYVSWNTDFKKRIEQLWQGIIGGTMLKGHYLVFDDESRTIFCRGRTLYVEDFKQALKHIDHYVPQVRINARIVLANKDFDEAIGFEWSGIYDRSAHIKNNMSFAGIGVGEKNISTDPSGFQDLLGWSLNFIPNSFRDLRSIKIPFSFGNQNLDANRINFMLNAAENRKEIETILKPSLLVKSQESAEILVGEEMPQETRLQETVEGSPTNVTTISYKDIGMKIKVKPIVSPDQKSIFLDVFVQNSYIDQSNVPSSSSSSSSNLGSFPFTVVTSRSSNKVVLEDGQTIMISGLIENRKERVKTGVPWIQDIPFLGWFFKGKRKHLADKQLLIFITPTLT